MSTPMIAINPESSLVKSARKRAPRAKKIAVEVQPLTAVETAQNAPEMTIPAPEVQTPSVPVETAAELHPLVRDTILAFSLSKKPETWVPLLLGIPTGLMIPIVTFGVKRYGFHDLKPEFHYGDTLASVSLNGDAGLFIVLALIVAGGLVFSALKMSRLFSDMYGKIPGVAMTVLAEATMCFLPTSNGVTTSLVYLCLSVLVGCNVVAAVKALRVHNPGASH